MEEIEKFEWCLKKNCGLYSMNRMCCRIRLFSSAPPGEHRKSMGFVIKRSISADEWEKFKATWDELKRREKEREKGSES